MSLIWFDGFEDQQLPNFNGWVGSASDDALTTTARTGTRATVAMGNAITLGRHLGTDEHATIVIGFAMRLNASAPSALDDFLSFWGDTGTTQHVTLNMKTDGAIEARRGASGGTLLGTTAASGFFTPNVYRYIEVKVVLHDTTGSVHVRIDGAEVLALTNQDTKNAGTETVLDYVQIQGMNACTLIADDIYILNGVDSGITGAPNNDFLGDCRVDELLPNADSTPDDWTLSAGTDTFALLDETPANGDTDYIESDVTNEKAQVGMTAHPVSGNEVFGVRVTAYAKKDDAGAANFRIGMHSDASDTNGADQALSTAYANYHEIFEADPDGGVQWTTTSVDAAEPFVEVR